MKIISKILIPAILILVASIIYLIYSNNSTDTLPPAAPGETQTFPSSDSTTVNPDTIKVKNLVTENTRDDFASLSMGETYIYQDYAFQVWFDENVGGEALLKRSGDVWNLVSLGGGAWEDYTLTSLGVPKDIAVHMVNNRPY